MDPSQLAMWFWTRAVTSTVRPAQVEHLVMASCGKSDRKSGLDTWKAREVCFYSIHTPSENHVFCIGVHASVWAVILLSPLPHPCACNRYCRAALTTSVAGSLAI